jgi:hypothetical protein
MYINAIYCDSNKLNTNMDKDLFIYDFLNSDLNKNSGTQISIKMNRDFSINKIIYVVNVNGNILHFQMY